MNWIVIVDSRLFALAFGVGVILIVGLVCGVLAGMDKAGARRKLSAQQDFIWARATRFMELGDSASMVLLLQNHGRELSTRQQRMIEKWLQDKAKRDNDE